MNTYDAIMKRRTIRKFKQDKIDRENLVTLVDCARMAAYGANTQPLKFAIIDREKMLDEIFQYTRWARSLLNGTPEKNERPTAYIAVLGDKSIKPGGNFDADGAAACTSMALAAVEMGISSCWLGALEKEKIKEALKLDDNLCVIYLLALGYAAQESKAVEMSDSIKYYLDENDIVNVPKRNLKEVLIEV